MPEAVLVYTSVVEHHVSSEELRSILDASRRNNAEVGITGLLLFDGRRYVQLLEGDPFRVVRLYERVRLDPRHKQIRMLLLAPLEGERTYPQWYMGMISPDEGDPKDLEPLMATLRAELDDLHATQHLAEAVELMQAFTRRAA